MERIKTDYVLNAKGLACPMPIVKTKKLMKELKAGQVIEIQATDKGSKADLKAWAESGGHQYLGTIEEGEVLKHYLRKASEEEIEEKNHPNVINNEGLENVLYSKSNVLLLDVREAAEYAFDHIPGAVSIPLGELNEKIQELDREKEIYVICRTGRRSDLAAQKLTENGFKNVVNVIPGMSQWSGKTEKSY
ncbi:sulfurtransferase TusA family protein [Heyndrickxia vini]|uniref:Sulfurtransferase TusA family protein n=1 Tax=Heyndrickxia vini TaxID=1476025 RepID=A0ABX7E205_9BACI|nr:sulfurtransferase TusA family protein [Heyndrickxia vini]QQZ09343.1 sulfurtransferase TusA family protein [Heyndrickxia vini]